MRCSPLLPGPGYYCTARARSMDTARLITQARNGARRLIGPLYWRTWDGHGSVEVLHHRTARPFLKAPLHDLPPEIADRFRASNVIEQDEYIHRVRGPAMIDPGSGFVVIAGKKVLTPSLPYAYQAGMPSITRSLAARLAPSRCVRYDRVISLRDVHEANYYHFFNDVLTRIPLLRDHGSLTSPMLVGKHLWRQPFFQELLPGFRAKGLELVDQGDRPVIADEIIYCKSMPHDKRHLLHELSFIDAPEVPNASERKVFLTRAPGAKGRRWLANATEVEDLMRSSGFEVLDAGLLTVREQMSTLATTRWLVAIHGAALTNMLFRKDAPMSVLELFPKESAPPHYYWFSILFGHRYTAMAGTSTSTHGAFSLPMEGLAAAVRHLVAGA